MVLHVPTLPTKAERTSYSSSDTHPHPVWNWPGPGHRRAHDHSL